jgi:hypothetical protein
MELNLGHHPDDTNHVPEIGREYNGVLELDVLLWFTPCLTMDALYRF